MGSGVDPPRGRRSSDSSPLKFPSSPEVMFLRLLGKLTNIIEIIPSSTVADISTPLENRAVITLFPPLVRITLIKP